MMYLITKRSNVVIFLILLNVLSILPGFTQAGNKADGIFEELQLFAQTSTVTGRESSALSSLRTLMPNRELQMDQLGNVYIELGSGSPKKLITVPLDEPGYVISEIQEDGFLRIAPVGYGHIGPLYHQFLEGHEVVIQTSTGPIIGVCTVPSTHFEGLRDIRERNKDIFQWQNAYIDIGASTRNEVLKKGIQCLDPLTLHKKVSLIKDRYLSAPAIREKAAIATLASLVREIDEQSLKGSITIAFSVLELLNGKGLEAIINQLGPFDEVYRFNRFLTSDIIEENKLLANKTILGDRKQYAVIPPLIDFRSPATTVDWSSIKMFEIGLPSLYAYTPVECVSISDVDNLKKYWANVIGLSSQPGNLEIVVQSLPLPSFQSYQEENDLLAELVAQYGVSGSEKDVRNTILNKLPKWASPRVDEKGNIILTIGQGDAHIAFVAHMDETGYLIEEIKEDGQLILGTRGGMLTWIWEAQPAMIHLAQTSIQGVFEPRTSYMNTQKRALPSPLTVNAGFSSREEALNAGIKPGTTTVTMPKKLVRLNHVKASARGFDDRVGCAALLLSLKSINPETLSQKISFIWAVEEETGLVGSSFAAKSLKGINTVYPIDTYVSSDDPYKTERFANCPLGEGAVIRVLESINFISRENHDRLRKLANRHHIPIQYGMTAGGTDGQAFLGYGIPSIPLSWPGRYSHSPVEVMDFRDLKSLVSLIQAIITEE